MAANQNKEQQENALFAAGFMAFEVVLSLALLTIGLSWLGSLPWWAALGLGIGIPLINVGFAGSLIAALRHETETAWGEGILITAAIFGMPILPFASTFDRVVPVAVFLFALAVRLFTRVLEDG